MKSISIRASLVLSACHPPLSDPITQFRARTLFISLLFLYSLKKLTSLVFELFAEPGGTDPVGGKIRRNISMARQFQMVSSKSLVRMPTSDSIEFKANGFKNFD